VRTAQSWRENQFCEFLTTSGPRVEDRFSDFENHWWKAYIYPVPISYPLVLGSQIMRTAQHQTERFPGVFWEPSVQRVTQDQFCKFRISWVSKHPRKENGCFWWICIDYLAIDSYLLVGHNEWPTCDIYTLLQYIIVLQQNFNTCLSINQLNLRFYFINIKYSWIFKILLHKKIGKKMWNFNIFEIFQWWVIGIGIWGIFWNPSYGCPWTIPKTISIITTSFSSLTTSFSKIITSFSY
jgi:hypothetical protein